MFRKNFFVQVLLAIYIGFIASNCQPNEFEFRGRCFASCNECEYNEKCDKCPGKNQVCMKNGNLGICKTVPQVKQITNCLSYETTDKSSITNKGYDCHKCDQDNGFRQDTETKKKCSNSCEKCFKVKKFMKKPCKVCSKKFICQNDPVENEANCLIIDKKKTILNCEYYRKKNKESDDTICEKCELGFVTNKAKTRCLNGCSKCTQDSVSCGLKNLDNVVCRTVKKIKKINAKKISEKNKYVIKKFEYIPENKRIFGCDQYKVLLNDEPMKCGKCLEDFTQSKDLTECRRFCNGELGEKSKDCFYKDKYEKLITDKMFCRLRDLNKGPHAVSNLCLPVKPELKVGNCLWYIIDVDNKPECGKCKKRYALDNNECTKKCDYLHQNCGKKSYCKYDKVDMKHGICKKKTIINCKRWYNYAEEELCRECKDGYWLDHKTRQHCIHADYVPGLHGYRRLMVKKDSVIEQLILDNNQ